MIKKLEIVLGIILFVLIIAIGVTIKNKSNEILPQDVTSDFFTEMMEGNFRVAMNTYLDNAKEDQINTLEQNIDLYKTHWANIGVDIKEETINKKEEKATCIIVVYKYNLEEILSDIKIRLLNVNTVKTDGTYITEDDLKLLKKQYIKDAYANREKYSHVINEYTLNLVWDEENNTWQIVNDKIITDILFGNQSNVK